MGIIRSSFSYSVNTDLIWVDASKLLFPTIYLHRLIGSDVFKFEEIMESLFVQFDDVKKQVCLFAWIFNIAHFHRTNTENVSNWAVAVRKQHSSCVKM